jgi:hypothetical protein
LIYTYDKIEFAKIQQQLVRSVWEPKFGKILICHSYNGKRKWYAGKHLENKLIRLKNPGHYEGAANLVDAGIKYLEDKVDYIVVSAADTWLLNLSVIAKYLKKMQQEGRTLLTCPWGTATRNKPGDVGLAGDFFILDAKWQHKYKMFPVKYREFADRYMDVIRYLGNGNVMYERLLFMRFLNACFREHGKENGLKEHSLKRYLEFSERIPVHCNEEWERPGENARLQLNTSHDRAEKVAFLKKNPLTKKIFGGLK